MEGVSSAPEEVCEDSGAASTPTTPVLHTRKSQHQKRKRRSSGGPWEGRHGGRGIRRTPHKKTQMPVSSTRAANNIMKFRLGGSVSDPLNLAGGDDVADNCSTCAPSPATPLHGELEPFDLPPQLMKDPLNLEGKVKNFPVSGAVAKAGGGGRALSLPAAQRKKPRRRTTSGSKPDSSSSVDNGKREKNFTFPYGNYNRYYGYRNEGGVNEEDPRLCLLEKEWFQDKLCLDIGCNTGQVTMAIARDFHPRHILGVDIDSALIKTAWKNVSRLHVPCVMPDGRSFPCSFAMSQGMLSLPDLMFPGLGSRKQTSSQSSGTSFPHNIAFRQMNYVPHSDDIVRNQEPEYDIIIALSLTKWIHLNWGDAGLKRFFKRVYAHLQPEGKFILEPQSFWSYHKRKKITEQIYKNYQDIKFYPDDFHEYLMSPEVGFSHYLYLGTSSNKAKGFQRPVYVYIKSAPSSDNFSCQPHSPLYEQPRLKSVVVVCPTSHTTSQSRPLSHHDQPDPPPLFPPPSSQPLPPSCQGDHQSCSPTLTQSWGSACEQRPRVTMETAPPTCGSHLPAETTPDQQLGSHGNSGAESHTD